VLVTMLIITVALLEAIATVSALPFVQLLIDANSLATSPALAWIHELVGRPPVATFVVVLGLLVISITFLSAAMDLLVLYVQYKFTVRAERRLARDLFKNCIEAPYEWFLTQNPTMLLRFIYEDSAHWSGFMQRLVRTGDQATTLLLSLGLLIAFSRASALLAIGSVGALAYAGFAFSRPQLIRFARIWRRAKDSVAISANQTIRGIKDVKLSAREPFFLQRFSDSYAIMTGARARSSVWQALPGMVLGALGRIALIVVALILWITGTEPAMIAAQLALLVIVTARALPAASAFSSGLGELWNAVPYIENIHTFRASIRAAERDTEIVRGTEVVRAGAPAQSSSWSNVDLDRVSYRYPGSDRWALRDVTTSIERGRSYGIVGRSGAGKSTLVDVIIGLLRPTDGRVLIDGRPLVRGDEHLWRSRIGYVPQSPYILDDDLRANIAFGVPGRKVDEARVLECLRLAHLASLPEELEHGLATPLGELGSRLSGGQRQRIAIARALFCEPEILVFDEATSALDSISEREILTALEELRSHLTLIVIAHRLSTVRAADRLFLLEGGGLVAQGTYDDLIRDQPLFRAMAAPASVA